MSIYHKIVGIKQLCHGSGSGAFDHNIYFQFSEVLQASEAEGDSSHNRLNLCLWVSGGLTVLLMTIWLVDEILQSFFCPNKTHLSSLNKTAEEEKLQSSDDVENSF